jgi:Outer membrane protein beta-barrel domain
MRKLSLVALLLLFCGTFAVAQESKGELFAGWSFMHLNGPSGCTECNIPAGFNLDGSYYFAKIVGATADFDYHHKDFGAGGTGRAYGLHFGPRVRMPIGKITPFAHALFGFTDLGGTSSGTTVSDKAFSTKLGGGLDVSASRHFSLRLGEFNYYLTKFDDTSTSTSPIAGSLNGQAHQNNYTFSAGIVIR